MKKIILFILLSSASSAVGKITIKKQKASPSSSQTSLPTSPTSSGNQSLSHSQISGGSTLSRAGSTELEISRIAPLEDGINGLKEVISQLQTQQKSIEDQLAHAKSNQEAILLKQEIENLEKERKLKQLAQDKRLKELEIVLAKASSKMKKDQDELIKKVEATQVLTKKLERLGQQYESLKQSGTPKEELDKLKGSMTDLETALNKAREESRAKAEEIEKLKEGLKSSETVRQEITQLRSTAEQAQKLAETSHQVMEAAQEKSTQLEMKLNALNESLAKEQQTFKAQQEELAQLRTQMQTIKGVSPEELQVLSEHLTQELGKREQAIKGMESTKALLERQAEELNAQMNKYQTEVDKRFETFEKALTAQVETRAAEEQALQSRINALEASAKVAASAEEQAKIKEELVHLREAKTKDAEQVNALVRELQQLKTDRAQIEALTAHVKDAQVGMQVIQEVQNKFASLEKRFEDVHQAITALQGKAIDRASLQKKIGELENKDELLQKDIQDLRDPGAIETMRQQVLKAVESAIKEQVAQGLEGVQKKDSSEVTTLAGQVKGLAEDVANGKKAIAKAMDELKAQIERGQAKLGNIPADLAQQLATLTTESKANAHEIEALREIPLALETLSKRFNKFTEGANERLDSVAKTQTTLGKEVADLSTGLEERIAELAEKAVRDKMGALGKTLEDLKKRIDDQSQDLDDLIKISTGQLTMLQKKLEDQEKKFEDQEKKFEDQEKKFEDQEEKLEGQEKEFSMLKEQQISLLSKEVSLIKEELVPWVKNVNDRLGGLQEQVEKAKDTTESIAQIVTSS